MRADTAAAPTTERWSALGGVLLSAMYLWVVAWLALAVLLPAIGLGWQPVVITSGSMSPLIRPGDVVLTVDDAAPEVGEVVTFVDPSRPDRLVTHRIVAVEEDGSYRTRGDANAVPDSTPVPSDNVLGRGRLLVPLVGLPLVWLSGGLLLFALWVAVTVAAAVTVSGRGGDAPREAAAGPATPAAAASAAFTEWVAARAGRIRPRAVQARAVAALSAVVDRALTRLDRGPRPAPSRTRRYVPGTLVLTSLTVAARTPAEIVTGVAALIAVVVLDPGGPHLPVGRWRRSGARAVRTVTSVIPLAVFGRGLVIVVGAAVIATALTGRSLATFSAAAPVPPGAGVVATAPQVVVADAPAAGGTRTGPAPAVVTGPRAGDPARPVAVR